MVRRAESSSPLDLDKLCYIPGASCHFFHKILASIKPNPISYIKAVAGRGYFINTLFLHLNSQIYFLIHLGAQLSCS